MLFNWKCYTVGLLLFAVSLLIFGCGGGSSQSTNTISGKSGLIGEGLARVTVAIAGAGFSRKTTDDSGNYSFTGLPNGDCTITPSNANYTFFPINQTITIANGNVSVPEFTATATTSTFTISGKVSLNGTVLAGVTVTITGAGSGSLTTDAGGNYTFIGVRNGDYTITPALTGYTFTPANRAFSVNSINITGQDFSAVAAPSGSIIFTF
jgi:Carboxypeptidase regulatory-like domain